MSGEIFGAFKKIFVDITKSAENMIWKKEAQSSLAQGSRMYSTTYQRRSLHANAIVESIWCYPEI